MISHNFCFYLIKKRKERRKKRIQRFILHNLMKSIDGKEAKIINFNYFCYLTLDISCTRYKTTQLIPSF